MFGTVLLTYFNPRTSVKCDFQGIAINKQTFVHLGITGEHFDSCLFTYQNIISVVKETQRLLEVTKHSVKPSDNISFMFE